MHRLVATTFKILMLSMLFMFLLDTSLLIVEIIGIHSKVSNITGTMQTELSRNNYMPTPMANAFTEFLVEIANRSTIMNGANDVTTNFSELTADNAGEYGDTRELEVTMTLHPTFAYYNPNRTESNSAWLGRGTPLDITLKYEYTVPCLRYLK